MPRLRILRGDDTLLDHRLRPGRTTIGRADHCDIALPGATISRLHCTIRGNAQGWRVDDHSRHGTWVDGKRVAGRANLSDGSRVRVGDFELVVMLSAVEPRPTALREPSRTHERILGAGVGGVRVERAALVLEEGPGAGGRMVLRTARASLGAAGSDLELPDPRLVRHQCHLRISRGRVMVEPGDGAVFLDGERVRTITPFYAEDSLQLGDTVLRVEPDHADEADVSTHFGDLVGRASATKTLFGVLRRMAGHDHPLLVVGESGTGKELIARAVHEHSPRAESPFVAINCGAIRPELFESTLFGHVQGAFTGADRTTDGAFQQADGGTLFLDEVGELPEASQTALLRALESGEVRRVGGAEVTFPDVRIVAATNRDLRRAIHDGGFRSDLYFRLAVLSVDVPPLRARPADIPLLVTHLLRGLHTEAHVTDEALAALKRHRWPGNVRELKNVLTRAYVMHGPRIPVQALSFHQLTEPHAVPSGPDSTGEVSEREHLQSVLARHKGNRTSAARELGMPRSTLHYRLKKLGIS